MILNNNNKIKETDMNYSFPALPYAYDALEPYIDRMTVEIHYTRHHKTYFDKFQAAILGTDLEGKTLEELFKNVSKYPSAIQNHGGGFYNHNLYWEIMSPRGGGAPVGKLGDAIVKQFHSFDEFKAKFGDTAANRFGSGWAWLCINEKGSLCVCSSANQNNPLMDVHDCPSSPILGLDLWEHAYYLKYQNRRPDYISAFWNVLNWENVNEKYEKVLGL
jgi:superoxide dismutase, Fe-Mn family